MTHAGRPGYAETARYAEDTGLRGLTCAIPFDDVWQVVLRLAGGGLSGWSITASDDYDGRVNAVTRSMFGAEHDVVIRVTLDDNAQTRVDMNVSARKPGTDFGGAARRIRKFFHALETNLARLPRRGLTHGR